MGTRQVQFQNHPIVVKVHNKVIDEDTIDYVVRFRNVGQEIMSFDYTIADMAGVPHVDAAGPNSGLIENIYPGAEIEVPNPTKKIGVFVTLGTVNYGKKTKDDIGRVYRPDAIPAGLSLPVGDAAGNTLLPGMPDPVPTN